MFEYFMSFYLLTVFSITFFALWQIEKHKNMKLKEREAEYKFLHLYDKDIEQMNKLKANKFNK